VADPYKDSAAARALGYRSSYAYRVAQGERRGLTAGQSTGKPGKGLPSISELRSQGVRIPKPSDEPRPPPGGGPPPETPEIPPDRFNNFHEPRDAQFGFDSYDEAADYVAADGNLAGLDAGGYLLIGRGEDGAWHIMIADPPRRSRAGSSGRGDDTAPGGA
jgi:hypothetical protein